MEEKRTPPELARAMMELLGCPCTYFAPMWDDDPLLECLQMNLEPEGGVHGVTPEQAAVAILTVMAAVLLMTMKVNSQWCGKTCGQQLYEAVFVTEDWS